MEKKKNIMFFTHWPISHIIPLIETLEMLKKHNYKMFFLGVENERILSNYGVFIKYPFDILSMTHKTEYDNEIKLMLSCYQNNQIKEGYRHYLKADIIRVHNISKENVELLKYILKENEISIIFRDSVDIYGHYLSKILNIPAVGYITNNMYSPEFFKGNEKKLYKIFMAANKIENLLGDDFFDNFYEYTLNLYAEVAKELDTIPVPRYNQFNLDEDFNIIYSTDFLQPKSSFNRYKQYLIIPPNIERFRLEENIDTNLIKFIGEEKIIYFSTGSFIGLTMDIYIDYISKLSKLGYKIVLSTPTKSAELKEYIYNHDLKNIYVGKKLPQQFLLQKSDLFISALGFNSLLEAIYWATPILAIPYTSEQRLNAIVVEQLGIGQSILDSTMELSDIVINIINNGEVKDKIKKSSFKMRKETAKYDSLFEYIDKVI